MSKQQQKHLPASTGLKDQERGEKSHPFTNQLTYDYNNFPGEINNEDSETIPGQSYEIADIIQRFTQGQSLNLSNSTPQYVGENFDDIDPTTAPDFDLTDVERIKNQIADNIKTRQQNYEAEQEQKRLETELKDNERREADAKTVSKP
jgi:hypothetical protein